MSTKSSDDKASRSVKTVVGPGVWERPPHVPYPKIWLRENGFVIRDVTPDIEPYVIEHMVANFVRDEPLNKSVHLEDDPVGIEDIKILWQETTPQKVSIVALAEGEPGADLKPVSSANPPRILGANILCVNHKNDPPLPPVEEMYRSLTARKILGTLIDISKKVNIFERYGVECYLEALGLSVCPTTRGKGLGLLLLRARLELCKGLGIPVSKTVFTNLVSQKIAAKAGFEVLVEQDCATEVLDERGNPRFPNIEPTKVIQLSAIRIS